MLSPVAPSSAWVALPLLVPPQPPAGSRNPTGSSTYWPVCSPGSVSLPSCHQSCLTGTKLMPLSAPYFGQWCHLPASSKPDEHWQVTLTPHTPLPLHTHHQLQPRLLQKRLSPPPPLSPRSYHLLPKQPHLCSPQTPPVKAPLLLSLCCQNAPASSCCCRIVSYAKVSPRPPGRSRGTEHTGRRDGGSQTWALTPAVSALRPCLGSQGPG